MVVDPVASQFFCKQREDVANTVCCDCPDAEAQWASVSHGIYLSIGASGVHRSLGVKVSRVLSTSMDSWKPLHLRMMELGGNERFRAFLEEHSVPRDMPIRRKYSTRAATWYRENLLAMAEGSTPPAPLAPGTGHLLVVDSTTSEQALLDDVFAVAPQRGMSSGGVSLDSCGSAASRAKRTSLSVSTQSSAKNLRTSTGSLQMPGASCAPREASCSPREPDSPGLMAIAKAVQGTLQGIRTARMLKTMSTKNMVGFGSENCSAAAARSSETSYLAGARQMAAFGA